MNDQLITTGEAAELLGVSPRTVARMVDRGDLPGYRIGHHRRIPRSSLPKQHVRRPHSEVTLLLGILIASKIIEEPDVAFELALRQLERQRSRPTQSASWTAAWTDLIDRRDVSQIIEVLTDAEDRTGLRQTQPFRGLISEGQRRAAFELAGADLSQP